MRKPGHGGETIAVLTKEGEDLLSHSGIPAARLEAEVLLGKSLSLPRSALLIDPDTEVAPSQVESYRADLARRATRYPLQYILGLQEFYSLDFEVDERVLIPRAETEIIVDEVLSLAGVERTPSQGDTRTAGVPHDHVGPVGAQNARRPGNGPELSIVDVGTGSGCIAITLAVRLATSKVLATDISAAALEVAKTNADRHGVTSRIQLEQGDGLQPALRRGWSARADFITTNPPYIAAHELEGLQRELSYEPGIALSGGTTGLEVIDPLVRDAANVLKPGGWLLMEMSSSRAAQVMALLDRTKWEDISMKTDLQGFPRVLLARRTS